MIIIDQRSCVCVCACTCVVCTYRAFPISCESSLPLVASMRAARELSNDRSSGQSLFMPEEVSGDDRVDKREEEEEEVRRRFDTDGEEESVLLSKKNVNF